MRPSEVLNIWGEFCRKRNVPWQIHRETLLCAAVYGEFLDMLQCAQVIVPRNAFCCLLSGGKADLPAGWKMKRKKEQICIEDGGKQILTADAAKPDDLRFSGEEESTLLCGVYPAEKAYREYLFREYGDYEAGIAEGIGTGFTREDIARLKAHQARCREAVDFLLQLRQEYGLRFVFLAGSVLGAVRHQGFIPWDDDVDIGVPAEEMEKFERTVKEQLPLRLPGEFSFLQSGAGKKYPRMFSKICCGGRCCVDLWPLVPTYCSGPKAQFTWYLEKLVTKVHFWKIGAEVSSMKSLIWIASLFLTDRGAMRLSRWNERKYAGKKAPAYVNLYSVYSRAKETIPRDWLENPAEGQFEGMSVPLVGNTEEYLRQLYGDYLSLPAPWNRGSRHIIRFDPDGQIM